MICPNCKTENPDGASYCYRCGTQLNVNQIQCPNCKNWNPADFQYCCRCGLSLHDENTKYNPQYGKQSQKPPVNPLNSKPRKKTSKITILFGILSFIFLFIFFYNWYSYSHYYLKCNEVEQFNYEQNKISDEIVSYSVTVKDAFDIYYSSFTNENESKAKKGAISDYQRSVEPGIWIFGLLSLLSLGVCGYSFYKNKNS